MKNILFALASLLLFCSCEYLDVVPEGKATEDDIWKTPEQVEKYRYYMQTYMPNLVGYAWSPDQFGGDDFMTGGKGTIYYFPSKSTLYDLESPSSTYYGRWAPCAITGSDGGGGTNYDIYRGIRYCFYMLDNVYNVPVLSKEVADRYAGEAWFLVAYYHQCLLEYYGPIVLVKKFIPLNAPESEILTPRVPYDECVNYIAECYDKAAALLPVKVPDAELGLPTKMAALSYKARLLLYAASPLVNGNPDYIGFNNPDGTPLMNTTYDREKWKRAMDAAEAAIQLADGIDPSSGDGHPNYYLYTSADSNLPAAERGRKNYRDTFVKEKWNAAEYIMGKGTTSGVRYLQWMGAPRSNTNNTGFRTTIVPTMEAVEMYYTENGLPIDIDPLTKNENLYAVAPGDNTALLHRHREPRFYAAIGYDRGTYEIDGKVIELQLRGGETHGSVLNDNFEYQSCTGYLCQKWVHKASIFNPSNNTVTYQYYAYPYLRLPELFFNYAEADFEYNGSLSSKSLEYLNRVRTRCGLPNFEESWARVGGIPSDPNLLRRVLHQERSIEFLFEGRRFHDLRRWKEAPEVMNKQPRSWNRDGKTAEEFYKVIEANQGGYVRTFISPKTYWLAIPNVEINKNPNLVQNPGY